MKTPSQIRQDLRKSYSQIARDFDGTRLHPWPAFDVFAEYIPAEAKVLDLGCGNGRLYAYLQEKLGSKLDYTGVDFCPELLALARRKYPQLDFEEQDIAQLELDRKFDVITAVASFHHLPSRRVRVQTLKRIAHHLEEDGLFMLSVWNLWQWKYLGAHLRSWAKWICSGFRHDPRDLMIPFGKQKVKRYYHAFLPSELRKCLKKAGFQILHWEVSGYNYLAVCQQGKAVAPSDPVPVHDKKMTRTLSRPSPVATYERSS